MGFEEGAANLLSIGVAVAIWYYGYNQTRLEWYWLLGGGLFGGLVTYKLFTGPFRSLLTLLRYLIIIGVLLAAAAFIVNYMQQNP